MSIRGDLILAFEIPDTFKARRHRLKGCWPKESVLMRYVNSHRAGRHVHLSSELWPSMHSKWHRMWWIVKISIADGPRADRNNKPRRRGSFPQAGPRDTASVKGPSGHPAEKRKGGHPSKGALSEENLPRVRKNVIASREPRVVVLPGRWFKVAVPLPGEPRHLRNADTAFIGDQRGVGVLGEAKFTCFDFSISAALRPRRARRHLSN